MIYLSEAVGDLLVSEVLAVSQLRKYRRFPQSAPENLVISLAEAVGDLLAS